MLKLFLLVALVTFPYKISIISSDLKLFSLMFFQSFPKLLDYFTRHSTEYKHRAGTGILDARKNINMISGFDSVEVIRVFKEKDDLALHSFT